MEESERRKLKRVKENNKKRLCVESVSRTEPLSSQCARFCFKKVLSNKSNNKIKKKKKKRRRRKKKKGGGGGGVTHTLAPLGRSDGVHPVFPTVLMSMTMYITYLVVHFTITKANQKIRRYKRQDETDNKGTINVSNRCILVYFRSVTKLCKSMMFASTRSASAQSVQQDSAVVTHMILAGICAACWFAIDACRIHADVTIMSTVATIAPATLKPVAASGGPATPAAATAPHP
jgi:hypothetical protein